MELAHLQLFVSVARQGNLTRAAAQVPVGQSTASRWLQTLERETGSELLERAGSGLRLTAAGRDFLPYAERAVRALEEGLSAAADQRSGRTGRLQLGCSDVTSTYFLPSLLRGFRSDHPNTELHVRVGTSGTVSDAVLTGDLEVGFVAASDDPRLDAVLLKADPFVCVLAAADPLAEQPTISLADLAQRGLIVYGMGEEAGWEGLAPFLTAHQRPRVAMEVDSVDTAKQMVAEGFGSALLPSLAVQPDLASGRLVTRPVAEVDLGHWHVRMVRRKASTPSGPAAAFWAWCADHTDQAHPHR